jgi:hypothetical protein
MLAALTASKLKHHKKVFAKRQDNALTASEFLAATDSASRRDQIRVCHLLFHCRRPYDYFPRRLMASLAQPEHAQLCGAYIRPSI